ncbi:hypothetical protein ACU5DF_20490 [Aliivibrio wodanis]|uniref:DinB-like domain-containing protein n=1 Tax=Aliivibrio wodanis TaxID=80852 RepID=A0A090IPG6_9GAMM|nr:putative uncharacterized protein [Aliivibrio wodanis]VVV05153.1 hypothetical protein AW0309160_02587 [Aliivibrio wodanis]
MPMKEREIIELSPVISGCIDELQQGLQLLNNISDRDYTHLASPYVDSSIGEHFRHILDLFYAIRTAQDEEAINYNNRRRGHLIETNKELAIKELNSIIQWLNLLPQQYLTRSISLITEVCPYVTQSHAMKSSIEREITFASLHASHHYALMKVITRLLNINTISTFGYAPTTSSFLRGDA